MAIPELQIKSTLRVHLLLDMMAISNKREDAERMYKPEGAGKGSKMLSSAHNIALHISTYNSCDYERRPPPRRRSSPSKFQNGWGGIPGDPHPWWRICVVDGCLGSESHSPWRTCSANWTSGILNNHLKRGQEVGRWTRW